MGTPTPSILVVDDDPDICRNLADIMADLGYRVDTAPDGPAAIELVRQNPYDVALLDFKMPGMDGLELYREVKRLRAGTVAIIVSAYTTATTREEALGAGAWRVLPKPVDLPELLGLVDEALGQPLVLVVDDDPDLCETLWDLCHERGYRVALARDGREVSEQLRAGSYKVVLIDMRLPDGDGSDVFRLVRQSCPDAHAVVITGHPRDLDDLAQRVLRDGADAVCCKPFDVPGLLATVDRLSREPPAPGGDPA
jgi:CheY-like chemotaxis protein